MHFDSIVKNKNKKQTCSVSPINASNFNGASDYSLDQGTDFTHYFERHTLYCDIHCLFVLKLIF